MYQTKIYIKYNIKFRYVIINRCKMLAIQRNIGALLHRFHLKMNIELKIYFGTFVYIPHVFMSLFLGTTSTKHWL